MNFIYTKEKIKELKNCVNVDLTTNYNAELKKYCEEINLDYAPIEEYGGISSFDELVELTAIINDLAWIILYERKQRKKELLKLGIIDELRCMKNNLKDLLKPKYEDYE